MVATVACNVSHPPIALTCNKTFSLSSGAVAVLETVNIMKHNYSNLNYSHAVSYLLLSMNP